VNSRRSAKEDFAYAIQHQGMNPLLSDQHTRNNQNLKILW